LGAQRLLRDDRPFAEALDGRVHGAGRHELDPVPAFGEGAGFRVHQAEDVYGGHQNP
jgi:hypothetical protein